MGVHPGAGTYPKVGAYWDTTGYRIAGQMILVNFIFGDLNAVHHKRACVKLLAGFEFGDFPKSSPNRQIKNLAKVSRYTVTNVTRGADAVYSTCECILYYVLITWLVTYLLPH